MPRFRTPVGSCFLRGEPEDVRLVDESRYNDTGDRSYASDLIPTSARRVLDVGCSHGGFGSGLKSSRPSIEVWGIDSDEAAAASAEARLDRFVLGSFPTALPTGERYDCISFLDVLEHFVDPWQTLRDTRALLNDGGCVVASIPNTRHFTVSARLFFHGEWTYTPTGLLDETHLRFFTRRSLPELFARGGFKIAEIVPFSYRRHKIDRVIRFFGRAGRDLTTTQYLVRAVPV